MPELPEVEVIRQALWPALAGRRVVGVALLEPRLPQNITAPSLQERLVGCRFTGCSRRGKYLLFKLSSGEGFVLHLRMTGQLLLEPTGSGDDGASREAADAADGEPATAEAPELARDFGSHPYDRMIWRLDSGRLVLRDQRRFATLHWSYRGDFTDLPFLERLGPEPLAQEFSPDVLARHLGRRRAPVKSVLLDQSCVAGLGNIYADEALHRSGIAPHKPACTLKEAEVARLHAAIREVLQEALQAGGTTIRDYRRANGEKGQFQARLRVYGKEGAPCPVCSQPIQRRRIGGRSSWFCARCQAS